MQIFLLESFDGRRALLSPEESKHCIKVLRHQAGDLIHCIDGKGTKYMGEIEKADEKKVLLRLSSPQENWGESPSYTLLVISPLRLKDRFEWAIEKAIELGVQEILPVNCTRTDPYKRKLNIPRLEKLLISATKQCKRSRIPTLLPAQTFESALKIAKEKTQLSLMGYCESQQAIQGLATRIKEVQHISIWIGPEGDFTEEESQVAAQHEVELISLGSNRLRTETAAIYALGILKYLKEN